MVFATVLVGLVGATSASAGAMNWFVNGTELKSGEKAALASTATVDSPTVLEVPGLSLEITCSGLSDTSAELVGGAAGEKATGQAQALKFETCSEITPPTCKLAPIDTNVTTEPVLALVLLVSSHPLPLVSVLFQPKTGNTFATLTFEGSKCSFAGEQGVSGRVLVSAPTGASEEATQAIEGLGSTENNSLIVDKNHACIGGKALLKLASGQKWSLRE